MRNANPTPSLTAPRVQKNSFFNVDNVVVSQIYGQYTILLVQALGVTVINLFS